MSLDLRESVAGIKLPEEEEPEELTLASAQTADIELDQQDIDYDTLPEDFDHDEVVELDDEVLPQEQDDDLAADRKSTRLNSSHVAISYAVFCLKKKRRGASAGYKGG